MRTPDGTTWLRIEESARRHDVRIGTLYQWRRRCINGRAKVRSFRIDGRVWVCDDDVADAELALRRRISA